jgi:hypothetical protein
MNVVSAQEPHSDHTTDQSNVALNETILFGLLHANTQATGQQPQSVRHDPNRDGGPGEPYLAVSIGLSIRHRTSTGKLFISLRVRTYARVGCHCRFVRIPLIALDIPCPLTFCTLISVLIDRMNDINQQQHPQRRDERRPTHWYAASGAEQSCGCRYAGVFRHRLRRHVFSALIQTRQASTTTLPG